LSAPIYQLKRRAKRLSREEAIPLHQALDRIAAREGFSAWSLLVAKATPSGELLPHLAPGDLVLLAARPGQGKTLLSLKLAADTMKAGRHSAFFTLEYTERETWEVFASIGIEPSQVGDRFRFDGSDAICADYIIERLASAPKGTLAVVDYLQLLDQRRENPDLAAQVQSLRAFAQARGLIFVLISQISRNYDPARKACPDLEDVRLPNPVDLKLFHKTCFMHGGEVRFQTTG
jgi:replicative DNA helicase